MTGVPLWDESHDFEGWWLGRYINVKKDRDRAQAEQAGGIASKQSAGAGKEEQVATPAAYPAG